MAYIFYQLQIAPEEFGPEGEDDDEWFTSLERACRRRRELIRLYPRLCDHKYGEDYAINKVVMADCSPKQLLLRVLNRTGFAKTQEEVLPPVTEWDDTPPW